jgi:ATP-dependent helicase/DNAse subunit B
MKHPLRCFAALAIFILAAGLGPAQEPAHRRAEEPANVRLPSGKSQQEEILKADHAKSIKDAAALIELSEQLKAELEKNDRHVLAISSLKKTEEIEKIAKRIRSRLRRF